VFRKGTTLIRKLVPDGTGRLKSAVIPLIDDIISDRFWKENPEVIGLKSLATYQLPNLTNNINTMPTSAPSPTTMKLVNNILSSSQVVNVNSEIQSNRSRETNEDQVQYDNKPICRR